MADTITDALIMERVYLKDRTLSSMYWNGDMIAKTLELPWLNNRRGVSCIPEADYECIRQEPKPSRPYGYFRLPFVEGRSGILMHRGVRPAHSKGCILVASRFKNIETQYPELEDSAKKLQWMIDNLPASFWLRITKKVL